MAHLLVTGAAGFIGSHVCLRLLARGDTVVGLGEQHALGELLGLQCCMQFRG